jgi:hypothetical protein
MVGRDWIPRQINSPEGRSVLSKTLETKTTESRTTHGVR